MGKLFLALLFSVGASAFAQNQTSTTLSTPAQMKLGHLPLHVQGLAGLNNSKILAKGGDSSNKDGFTLGALADLGSGSLVLETGFLYMQMGASAAEGNMKLKVNYFAIPVYAKYFNDPRQVGFYSKAGVAFADLRSSKLSVSTGNGSTKEVDFEHNTKGEDLMLGAGIGYVFDTESSTDFLVELSFLRGTQHVLENLKDQAGQPLDTSRTYNESISLRAGVRL